jgi:hypothetical protein
MSAFRGLRSSEGHHGAPGRSLLTYSRRRCIEIGDLFGGESALHDDGFGARLADRDQTFPLST